MNKEFFPKRIWRSILCIGILVALNCSFVHADNKNSKYFTEAARIYLERCDLCHGKFGMGEGTLALLLQTYPDTNLHTEIKAKSRDDVKKVIAEGPMLKHISNQMPPWKDELSSSELDMITDYVMYLRKNTAEAWQYVEINQTQPQPTVEKGRDIYLGRCTICHGQEGRGDGKMRKIVKNPPPADLTASRLPNDYLTQIILKGGEGVGRSPQMPPWGDQLDSEEMLSLLMFLHTIRE